MKTVRNPGSLALMLWLFFSAGNSWSRDKFRIFTDVEGRSVQARIVGYDVEGKHLVMERADRKRVCISDVSFCVDDRNYIQQWIDLNSSISKDLLDITVSPKQKSFYQTTAKGRRQKVLRYHLSLKMKNQSDDTLEGLTVEYRYFWEIREFGEAVKQHQITGYIVVGSVTNGVAHSINTDTLELITEHKKKNRATFFGIDSSEVKVRDDRLVGICIKVHAVSPKGIQVVREICMPEDLHQKVVWEETDS